MKHFNGNYGNFLSGVNGVNNTMNASRQINEMYILASSKLELARIFSCRRISLLKTLQSVKLNFNKKFLESKHAQTAVCMHYEIQTLVKIDYFTKPEGVGAKTNNENSFTFLHLFHT